MAFVATLLGVSVLFALLYAAMGLLVYVSLENVIGHYDGGKRYYLSTRWLFEVGTIYNLHRAYSTEMRRKIEQDIKDATK